MIMTAIAIPVPNSSPLSGPSSSTAKLLILFGLLVAGWIAYAQVTGFDFIPLDDPGYVYENQSVQGGLTTRGVFWAFTTMERANWHPLTWLSLMSDYQLYGLNPGGYHLTNFLLHEISTALLFGWLLLATNRLWPSAGVALLFCVHPAHVESVAWVTERKDVLSTVFFCLVLGFYTLFARTRHRGWYLAAFLALALGLLAKPMLVSLPPLLLLVDVWPLGRARRWRDLIALAVEKIPFAVVAALSCVITFVAQHRGGATVSLESLPFSWRLSSAVSAYGAYLSKLLWPVDLGVFYPYAHGIQATRALVSVAVLAGVTGGAAWCHRTRPYLLVGWLWFLGGLVPVIGLVQVGSQAMADRYTYQPAIGIFIALCWTTADFWKTRLGLRPVLAIGCPAALAACLFLCQRQVGYWQDGVILLRHTLAVTRPTCSAHTLLGDSYARQQRYTDAEASYRQAFLLKSDNVELIEKLGYLQLEQGHWEEAHGWLRQVAERDDCDDPVLYNNYGYALNRLHLYDEARAAIAHSLRLRPTYGLAHNNLGDTLRESGQNDAAAAEYEAALSAKPDLVPALAQLAWLYSFADHEPTPARASRALVLARRAVDLSGGQSVASLDALAAAEAASSHWPQAATASRAARMIAGEAHASTEVLTLHDERAASYHAGEWPRR